MGIPSSLLGSPIGRLRLIGWIEGTSYLALLGIAMPLKYLAGQPMAVKVTGWIHGLLFIVFCLVLLQAMIHRSWSLFRAIRYFIAAVVPFGTFIVDGELKREQEGTGPGQDEASVLEGADGSGSVASEPSQIPTTAPSAAVSGRVDVSQFSDVPSAEGGVDEAPSDE